ncbi:MAG: hypothetical protein H6512_07920 [Acidimicrobiia bacterium]|nr:hypothetical protein [Acidimicrobiia bacterium]
MLTGGCVLLSGGELAMGGEELGVLDSTVPTGAPVGADVRTSTPADVLVVVECASPASTVVELSATDEVVSSLGSASLVPTAPRVEVSHPVRRHRM